MVWSVCMYLAYGILALLLILFLWAFIRQFKIEKISTVAFAGVFVAAVIMFYPCYIDMFHGFILDWIKALMACIHHTIRLFIVDGEMTFVIDSVIGKAPAELQSPYIVLASIIFIAAPIFTFGFILSFFRSVSAYIHYLMGYGKDKYIFSVINESTLALAEDIRKNHRSAMIVFTDTDEKETESHYNYLERVQKIKAVCFKKDIASMNIGLSSRSANIYLFLLSLDESANHKQSAILCEKYASMKNITMYVHSVFTDNELMPGNSLSDKERNKVSHIRIRRVNDVRLLINNILYNKGHRIFDAAVKDEESGEKIISAVVVGMGNHGTEMMKALPSFCQMDGYKAYITALDKNPSACSFFTSMCPELMAKEHREDFTTPGEAHYKIDFYDGIDVRSSEFSDIINNIPHITYVYISLGDDSMNIYAAKKVHTLCANRGLKPLVQTVVYDTESTEILRNNKTEERYDIEFVGDIKSFYTEEVIMASEVERVALQRHLKWGSEEEFWNSEYNYKSSVASAIHRKMKEYCRIPGIEKAPEDRTDEERENIRVLEHKRWNAYMRSEGYVRGEKKDHVLKTHSDLRPFYELSPEDQAKDDD